MNGANRATHPNVYATRPSNNLNNEIIRSTQAGLPNTFTELHSTYSPRLYRTIIAITKNPQDAEDALQDTFMRVYLSFHTFEGRSNIYSWLTRIAINSALMLLRRRRTRPETLVDFLPDTHDGNACVEIKDPSPTPEQAYEFYSLQTVVMRKLNRLEPHLREPIQIQMTQGCSINEIAQRLNISKAAVKSRLHRARQRLSSVREVKRPIILHRDYLTPPIED